jgi:hypothetical protein
MRSKNIYLITHGEKTKDINSPNPDMTTEGLEQILALKPEIDKHLLDGPSQVYAGMGKRQCKIFEALGVPLEQVIFSPIFGLGCSLMKIDGQKKLLLPHGLLIDFNQAVTGQHVGEAINNQIPELPDNSLICGGTQILLWMGNPVEENFNGALYVFRVSDNKIQQVELLVKK